MEVLYRVIKMSLCTWRLYCNHQVHREFLSPCIIFSLNLVSTWNW